MQDKEKSHGSIPGGVEASESKGKTNFKGGRMARKVGRHKGGRKRGGRKHGHKK